MIDDLRPDADGKTVICEGNALGGQGILGGLPARNAQTILVGAAFDAETQTFHGPEPGLADIQKTIAWSFIRIVAVNSFHRFLHGGKSCSGINSGKIRVQRDGFFEETALRTPSLSSFIYLWRP